ncbi:hypothetical protein [Rhizobium sp. X9]|uniref:hypothetical protein n=1 Tax=Rhizobium sp. X9 TaxID=2815360 RepID=UPI001C0D85B5|nr:hypothetical protein [Rhizobium sp. X9]
MNKKNILRRVVVALGAVGVLTIVLLVGALGTGLRIVDVPADDASGKMRRVIGLPLYGYSILDTVSDFCSRRFPESGAISGYERTKCVDDAVHNIATKKFIVTIREWETVF